MRFTDLRIKIRRFFRKNKNKVLIIVIVWSIVIIINNILRNYEPQAQLEITYEPHSSVMEYTEKVPEELQEPIEKYIEEYVGYCNSGEYKKAYDMLSEDCKENLYPSLYSFKKHIDGVFDQYKRYCIQAYSIVDDMYIYQVKLFNDFLATGITNDEYKYFDEKFTIRENEDGTINLCVGNYIATEKIQSIVEKDDIKIDIKQRILKYDREIYTVRISNKSEYTLVVADNNENKEVLIGLGSTETRGREEVNSNIILAPGESKEFTCTFFKYYDDNSISDRMIFSSIRFFENYTNDSENAQEEIENAISKYSLTVEF